MTEGSTNSILLLRVKFIQTMQLHTKRYLQRFRSKKMQFKSPKQMT